MKTLKRNELKKIKGGCQNELISNLAECTKDCGGGKSVTCDGDTCSTTPEGCYSSTGGNVGFFLLCKDA